MKLKKKDRPGYLIVFEGIDGSGKGTQIELLKKFLPAIFNEGEFSPLQVFTKEPGGSAIGFAIREILFPTSPENVDDLGTRNMAPNVRNLLCLAAHVQHSAKLVVLYLQRGGVIVCDRYLYSDFAYDEAEHEPLLDRTRHALMGPEPDLVIFLHGDPATFQERAMSRTTETHQVNKVWNDVDRLRQVQNRYFDIFRPLELKGKLLQVRGDEGTPEQIFEAAIRPVVEFRLKKHFKLK